MKKIIVKLGTFKEKYPCFCRCLYTGTIPCIIGICALLVGESMSIMSNDMTTALGYEPVNNSIIHATYTTGQIWLICLTPPFIYLVTYILARALISTEDYTPYSSTTVPPQKIKRTRVWL